ncbi:hypothetical protein PACTADRAFT_71172 [Pachysolen tannophilus NRRL Y-2460]|uniref:mRNA transport regulator MTR2 n=1 Tax=Pachysolen tannophilus NRRL Y-2460 TaxID=669874 RepID=A0A1E4TRQ8_PACTA|nr:hypothetical protein PACTADRAFT_71172 [Pachysolen tannophilus NRRL Y-2460]
MSAASDPTSNVEPFLKKIISTLDNQFITSPSQYQNNVQLFKASILPQLKQQSAVIINGSPYASKTQLQEIWSNLPISQHQLTSYDTHLIPGSGTFIISCSLKVRFDESGKTRLGESAELVQNNSHTGNTNVAVVKLWSSWYGVNLNLVVDEIISSNTDVESINSFNYRFTYKPENSIISL